jgi:hypothetical protein
MNNEHSDDAQTKSHAGTTGDLSTVWRTEEKAMYRRSWQGSDSESPGESDPVDELGQSHPMINKYIRVCSRCNAMIDIESEVIVLNVDAYHVGCEPHSDGHHPGKDGQGEPSATAVSGGQVSDQEVASLPSDDVRAEGPHWSDTPRQRDRSRGTDHPDHLSQDDAYREFCAAVWSNLRYWRLEIVSEGTYRRLYAMGTTIEKFDRAIAVARRNDALNVGYIFAVCVTYSDPDEWEKARAKPIVHVGPGTRWLPSEDDALREMVIDDRLEIPELAIWFHRTEGAIRSRIERVAPEMIGTALYPKLGEPIPPLGTKYKVATLAEQLDSLAGLSTRFQA